jgi:hypothetical protein
MIGQLPPPAPATARRSGRGVAVLAIAVTILSGTALSWWLRSTADAAPNDSPPAAVRLPPDGMAPAGARVRVRVINTTGTRGLARRASNLVRDLGYDVVDYDSESTKLATTTILVHTGHDDWARRLARGVSAESIAVDADSSRYVDLTLLIGSDWKPAAQPFRP